MKHNYKEYKRTGTTLMMPVTQGQISLGLAPYISISQADIDNGSPKIGDMIAKSATNSKDMWLVNRGYFEANYELATNEYCCEICGNEDAEETIDPYQLEMYDEEVVRMLCSKCTYQLSQDI